MADGTRKICPCKLNEIFCLKFQTDSPSLTKHARKRSEVTLNQNFVRRNIQGENSSPNHPNRQSSKVVKQRESLIIACIQQLRGLNN